MCIYLQYEVTYFLSFIDISTKNKYCSFYFLHIRSENQAELHIEIEIQTEARTGIEPNQVEPSASLVVSTPL